MGKVIQYTNKPKRRRKGVPSDNAASAPPASSKTKGKRRPAEAIGTWSKADLDLHRQLLLKLMREGEFSEAKIVAKHLTDLQPEDSYAWYLRGTALLELSDPEQAEPCLLRSIELAGTDGFDCYQMSRARLLQGDLEGAVDWGRRALELAPKNPAFHRHMSNIHAIRGDLDAAIAAAKEALPKMVEKYDRVAARLDLANLYISTSDFDEAKIQLKAALKLEPDNAELWSKFGHCLSRQHKTEEALNSFLRAAEIEPDDARHQYNIGDAYLGLDKPEEALKPLLRAVRLDNDYSLAHYDLSLAYLDLKQYPEAEAAAGAALRDDPEMEVQRTNLGIGATENLGVALMNQGRLEEAEACFRRNLRMIASTYFNLGLALFRAERYEKALENFRRALELEPEDPEYHNLVGDTYDELGQLDEAEKYLRSAIEIDKKYAMGHYDLGVFLSRRRGQKEKAVAAFKQALKSDPDMVQAYYGIACTYALLREEGAALESLETALQKGFRDFDHIENDSDWDGFRKNPKFIRLLGKYHDMETTTW